MCIYRTYLKFSQTLQCRNHQHQRQTKTTCIDSVRNKFSVVFSDVVPCCGREACSPPPPTTPPGPWNCFCRSHVLLGGLTILDWSVGEHSGNSILALWTGALVCGLATPPCGKNDNVVTVTKTRELANTDPNSFPGSLLFLSLEKSLGMRLILTSRSGCLCRDPICHFGEGISILSDFLGLTFSL